jgi:hypothetical protein
MCRQCFEPFGKVDRIKKIKDYAFVHFEERDNAVEGGTTQLSTYVPLLWSRIRIHLAVLDPDPCWECGSGSRSMEILTKITNMLPVLDPATQPDLDEDKRLDLDRILYATES